MSNKRDSNNDDKVISLDQVRDLQRREAFANLMTACQAYYGDGPVLIVCDWGAAYQGVASEVQLPDGSTMAVFTSAPIPDGQALMLIPDGKGAFDCRLAVPARDSNGQEIAFTPLEAEVPIMVIPDQDDD